MKSVAMYKVGMKSLLALVVAITALLPIPALAHGDSIEHALAHWVRPGVWLDLLGVVLPLWLIFSVYGFWILRRARGVNKGALRYLEATAIMFLLWLLLGSLQNLVPEAYFLLTFGYAILPIALMTAWLFVLVNFRDTVRAVLKRRLYLTVALAAAFIFAAAYLWSTNLVAPPEPDEMPSPGTPAFLIPFQAYGPLTIWPNIEFWVPQVSVFGAISVGTGMVVLTLASLVGISIALLAYSIKHRVACYRGGTVLGGGAVVALGTNFCCCCAPAIYPLLALVLGSTTASSLAIWMIGSSSPFYNLTQVVTLSITLIGITLLSRRIMAGGFVGDGSESVEEISLGHETHREIPIL